jgi:hypothetical protein
MWVQLHVESTKRCCQLDVFKIRLACTANLKHEAALLHHHVFTNQ